MRTHLSGAQARGMNTWLQTQTWGATSSSSSTGRKMTCRKALNSAMDEELARDERLFVIGEEVEEYDVLTK